MATKLSARVMQRTEAGETHVDFYIRSVEKGVKLLDPDAAVDGWAAYSERVVFVEIDGRQEQLLRAERVSTSPRATIEEAAVDMYAANRATKGTLYGDVPEGAIWGGADPMGDE